MHAAALAAHDYSSLPVAQASHKVGGRFMLCLEIYEAA